MSRSRKHTTKLLAWYTEQARPFLEKHAPGDVPAIDQQRDRAEHLARIAEEEVAVCFLGAAGVGKSTLINALMSEDLDILPHGGIGPLTAQATIIRYAEAPYFQATYLPASKLNQSRFILEASHERAQKRVQSTNGLADALNEEDRRDAEAVLPSPDAEAADTEATLMALQRQVRLLIQGEQHGEIDLPYLIDALRAVLGQPARWGRSPSPEDMPRIERLRECLARAQHEHGAHHRVSSVSTEEFFRDLRDHASGFLAPLLKTLEVGWNAEGLRDGLVLADLPGIGVANDEYRSVTDEWIRQRARAIVLVVDRSGVTEASADLLRSTGFLNRLMHDSYDTTADPVALAVAVVKVDDSARSAWQDDRALRGTGARKWNEHFKEACAKAIELVRGQMRQELDKLVQAGPEATRTERGDALARVLDSLEIHPVSAPQYRLFHLQDEEDPPRIKSAEESRIPTLLAALRALAMKQRRRHQERADGAARDFGRHIQAVLGLVRAQWDENLRAEKEAQELRADLDGFLAPLGSELERRQGAFRELLRESIPAQIDARVGEATLAAKADIARFLRKLESLHWATLRATVRRGGAYVSRSGKHIDLPNDLALRFEEPIAVVWSKHILTLLRTRTAELGQDYVAMVGEVVDWARAQNARVQPRLIDALHEKLKVETRELSSVGKEAVDELKKKVRAELHGKLVKRIRQRCEKFIEDKQDEGPGVKKRILELFHDELADGIADTAKPLAIAVLRDNYREVERDISERFAAYGNPLASARDAIVSSHEDSVRRSDAQRKKRVLAELDALLAGMPGADA